MYVIQKSNSDMLLETGTTKKLIKIYDYIPGMIILFCNV